MDELTVVDSTGKPKIQLGETETYIKEDGTKIPLVQAQEAVESQEKESRQA